MEIFCEEMAALYTAFAAGQPSPLAALPIQYADFAAWQREYLSGEVLSRQLEEWRRRLAGAPEILEVPLDFPRPPHTSSRGNQVRILLSASLANQAEVLARREGATLFILLLSVFKALLLRDTGYTDIVVGTPVANRNQVEVESLIGLFVNPLVLRTDLSGPLTTLELLGRVRETVLDAFSNQDLPFDRLVDALAPHRNLQHTPIFQVMFAFFHREKEWSVPGFDLQLLPNESETARFDLTFMVQQGRDGLLISFGYRTDLFATSSMERRLNRLVALLEGALREPGSRLAELPVLSAAEHHQLVLDWNDTAFAPPPGALLHELFTDSAARWPDAIAVTTTQASLSYSESSNGVRRRSRSGCFAWG